MSKQQQQQQSSSSFIKKKKKKDKRRLVLLAFALSASICTTLRFLSISMLVATTTKSSSRDDSIAVQPVAARTDSGGPTVVARRGRAGGRPSTIVMSKTKNMNTTWLLPSPPTHRPQGNLHSTTTHTEANSNHSTTTSSSSSTSGSSNTSQFQGYSYDSDVVVFYHIFVPNDQGDEGVNRALQIVQEQLDQVGNSYAVTRGRAYINKRNNNNDTHPITQRRRLKVYYTTVGMQGALNATFIEQVCTERNHLDCIHVQHSDHGHEEVMLQRVHDYCRQQRPPTTTWTPQQQKVKEADEDEDTAIHHNNKKIRVIYLHTKGTFHPHPGQQHWRRYMTAAATSASCVNPPNETCNVCGLLYTPIPGSHFPGNIFTADCDYIRKLLPLDEFAKKKHAQVLDAMKNKKRAFSIHAFLERNLEKDYFWGVGRYAAEHWIASHPTVWPCDVSRKVNLRFWWEAGRNTTVDDSSDFEFGMAPRRNLVGLRWPVLEQKFRMKQVVASDELRLSDISLLAGAIHCWISLYNATPEADSWVWSWFPDGQEWKRSVQQHWSGALEVMLGNHSNGVAQKWRRDVKRHASVFLKEFDTP